MTASLFSKVLSGGRQMGPTLLVHFRDDFSVIMAMSLTCEDMTVILLGFIFIRNSALRPFAILILYPSEIGKFCILYFIPMYSCR